MKTAELWGGRALNLSLRYVTLSLFHSAVSGNQCDNAHKEQSKQSTGLAYGTMYYIGTITFFFVLVFSVCMVRMCECVHDACVIHVDA